MRRLLPVVLALAAVAGCGQVGSTIDGWLIGSVATCTDRTVTAEGVEVQRGTCAELMAAAARAFDARDPNHAPVVRSQLYDRRSPPGSYGGLQFVQVFQLVDGSLRAIGVGWPGVSVTPYTIDYGP